MKVPSLKEIGKSPIQWIVLAIIAIFLVMPIQVPGHVASIVDSTLGISSLFLLGIYLFLNAHPILAVAFILFAYELHRRSSNRMHMQNSMIEFTPTESKRDEEMSKMNPSSDRTLEEEVVSQMAPTSKGVFVETSFKPVADDIYQASKI